MICLCGAAAAAQMEGFFESWFFQLIRCQFSSVEVWNGLESHFSHLICFIFAVGKFCFRILFICVISWSWFIPLRTLDRCYPWLYFPLLFVRVVGGRKGHFDSVRSRMVLEDNLWQRNDEGKQLKFGTSLCVLLQLKSAEFDSPVVLLGEGAWAFAFVDLPARVFMFIVFFIVFLLDFVFVLSSSLWVLESAIQSEEALRPEDRVSIEHLQGSSALKVLAAFGAAWSSATRQVGQFAIYILACESSACNARMHPGLV